MKNYFALLFLLLMTFSCKTDPADANKNQASTQKTEAANTKPSEPSTPAANISSLKHYICFSDNDNPDNKIWISFSTDNKALEMKHSGQDNPSQLMFESEQLSGDGANPITDSYYYELANGKKKGRVKLTHSGDRDYVEYVKGREGKVYNFSIDPDADPSAEEPCF